MVEEELFKRIDGFLFENRCTSRSAAPLGLIRLGMEALEVKQGEAEGQHGCGRQSGAGGSR